MEGGRKSATAKVLATSVGDGPSNCSLRMQRRRNKIASCSRLDLQPQITAENRLREKDCLCPYAPVQFRFSPPVFFRKVSSAHSEFPSPKLSLARYSAILLRSAFFRFPIRKCRLNSAGCLYGSLLHSRCIEAVRLGANFISCTSC
jgi:hypothetical protein